LQDKAWQIGRKIKINIKKHTKMRFRKRLKIAKGISLNLSGSGASLTFGVKGLSVNIGKKGTYLNTGIPGTGLYSRQKISGNSTQSNMDYSNSISDSISEPISKVKKVKIDVKLDEKGDTILQVFDMSGREIFDETIILKVKGSDGYRNIVEQLLKERSIEIEKNNQSTKKVEKVKQTNKKVVEAEQISYFDKKTKEIPPSENAMKLKTSQNSKKIVPHQKFKEFQDKYGAIPASDKNDHLTKSRMLQGIYRNQKVENEYCNYVFGDNGFVNFMRNKQLQADAQKELDSIKQRERLTDEKRLFENLLSSQPLAFNIFLPLKWHNFSVGNTVFKELFPLLNIKQIVDIKLEYVPGDGKGKNNRKITTDNSCFDVYVEYQNNKNELCGIGIEVKYTESFSQSDYWKETGYKKDRYIDTIQKYSAQFSMENAKEYLQPKCNQLFRNQLLAEEVKDKFNKDCIVAAVDTRKDTIIVPDSNNHYNNSQMQDGTILFQNTPNPFSSNTEISCYIPEMLNNAFIYVYNLQGVQLKSFPVTQGLNKVIIYASELPAGMYLYTLVVDNVIIDTKRMILTK
jgi:hypothetical protein